jgi:hypothetical protein
MLEIMEYPETVFRSADASAQEDAAAVLEMLAAQGIPGALADDSVPGVPSGAWEVRVAESQRAQAEAVVAASRIEEDPDQFDESSDLDLVTVFEGAGSTSEMEAMSVKSLLEANGIEAFLVGDTRLPNLPEKVRVPRGEVTEAKRIIADALSAGAAGADEAEAGDR